MKVQAILKEADEILFFDFIEKNASVSPQWLKQHRREINELFMKYIREKTFPDVTGRGKVPYGQLSPKYKEKVWEQFMRELETKVNSIEEQVEEVIRNFKPKQMTTV
jgi:nitrogen regulatory protein PII